MPHALFISPHLDDVAFSCGGTFAMLAASGWTTTLCTIFTRSVPLPTGFALACQLDKGIAPDIDYLGLRRAEDERAARALGATYVRHLDLPEAPHRGYESAGALFGAYAPQDTIAADLDARISALSIACDLVFAPQALGSHVDHRRVRDAVLKSVRTQNVEDRVLWYRDAPYVLRAPDELPEPELVASAPLKFGFSLDAAALEAKLAACAAYATQLGFQFNGEGAMRAALRSFARDETSRFSIPGSEWCEGFRSHRAAVRD